MDQERFSWAFISGVVEAGAASLGAALHASQDPTTGQIDGTFFADGEDSAAGRYIPSR